MEKHDPMIGLDSLQNAVRAVLNWFPLRGRWLVAGALVYAAAGYMLAQWANATGLEVKHAIWVQIVLLIAVMVLSELLRPKQRFEEARPGSLGDIEFPTSTEGRPVPLLWGRALVNGVNLLWYGDFNQQNIKQRVDGGWFSSDKWITVGFRTYLAWQQGICRGPGVVLRGVYCDDTLIWSGTVSTSGTTVSFSNLNFFGGDSLGQGGIRGRITFFNGDSGQPVSAFLNAPQRQRLSAPSPTAPRYAGTSYVIFTDERGDTEQAGGAYIGNSLRVPRFGCDVQRIPTLFPGQSSGQNTIGSDGDANPVNVIYEILTNTEWGLGRPAAEIDTGAGSSFLSASTTAISEGIGFSLLLDNPIEAGDLLQELERHIDGVIYRNLATGKWEIKLARADYDIMTVPEFNETNSDIVSFSRTSWEGTTNQVQVKFSNRADNYKESYALAQDMANSLIQGNGVFSTNQITTAEVRFPGVKTADIAAKFAWRELRTLAYPVARATFAVHRQFWDLQIGSVIAWTSSSYGFTKLPMRVASIDYGTLDNNGMKIETVQDVFYTLAPSFGSPSTSQWSPPALSPEAYDGGNIFLLEAPFLLTINYEFQEFIVDPANQYQFVRPSYFLLFISLRRQAGELQTLPEVRINGGANTVTAYPFDEFSDYGTLVSSMPAQQANPVTSVDINAPATFLSFVNQDMTLEDLGQDPEHLIVIDDEIMLFQTATDLGGGVYRLNNVYRGALDTVQRAHSASAKVWLLNMGASFVRRPVGYRAPGSGYTGGGGNYLGFENNRSTDLLDIAFRMSDGTNTYTGAVTRYGASISLSPGSAQRQCRPLTPSAIRYNGSATTFTTPSLEGAGSGLNGFRTDVNWWRRDWRNLDAVDALTSDDTNIFASTEYQLEVRADPAGANTLVGAISAWTTGNGPLQITRNSILMAAAAGTMLRFILRSRHDYSYTGYGTAGPSTQNNIPSFFDFHHDVTPTSSLTGQFRLNTGTSGLAANVASASYTAAATGTFTVNIGAAQASAVIEVSINSGAWTTVVTVGATTGTFSATSGDGIRLRRTVSEAPNPQFVELRNPSTAAVAYGVFNN